MAFVVQSKGAFPFPPGEGSSRLHADSSTVLVEPEIQGGAGYEVQVSGTDPADRDADVGLIEGFGDRTSRVLQVVGGPGHRHHLGAEILQGGSKHRTVAIADPVAIVGLVEGVIDIAEFISGREDRAARSSRGTPGRSRPR